MGWTKKDRSEKIFKLIVIFAIIITIIIGIWWFWFQEKPKQTAVVPPARVIDKPVKSPEIQPPEPRTVIRYDKNDENFQELMKQRKAEYGLDKGVDMIIKENESVKIGDTVIPMEEILNKIRLKKGQVIEQDIGSLLTAQKKQESIERLFEKLKESEARFWELEKELNSGNLQDHIQEHAELSKIVKKYQSYKETLQDIETQQEILNSDDIKKKNLEIIKNLEEKKQALENELKKQVAARTSKDIPDNPAALFEELNKLENRFFELETELNNPEIQANKDIFQKKNQERAALRQIVAGYNLYKRIGKEIEGKRNLLNNDDKQVKEILQNRLTALRIKRDDLENDLKLKLLPDESLDVYGVYVVRPGDNVWNIHFNFLKEYLQNRGIHLSSSADEPLRPGISSGVGKILKFSENMVYIFNLKEHKLSLDLNIIHPLSKIVVFNMGQVFDLLNQLNYSNIKHIRFDGENIWIPAEQ